MAAAGFGLFVLARKIDRVNDTTLEKIADELNSVLTGRKLGQIFSLSRFQIAIDFRGSFLFISIEPREPRSYLIRRRLKDIERQAAGPSPFILYLRKRVSEAAVKTIMKMPRERILRIALSAVNETSGTRDFCLIVQLTGRSSNVFLLDADDVILESMRDNTGPGQEIGDRYHAPPRPLEREQRDPGEALKPDHGQTLSEALDKHYLDKDAKQSFLSKANAARAKLRAEIKKNKTLIGRLDDDLRQHGDAEKWRRYGDLLLANISTASRDGDQVSVTDYFDENAPEISIPVDQTDSITEAAEKFFKRYTKARNASTEIGKRREHAEAELARLSKESERLEQAIFAGNEDFFASERDVPATGRKTLNKGAGGTISGVRRFSSSEGFEILVGKKAKDNDFLTFRIAKSLDLWLHAADYPGSHVVVRNPSRKEIPHKTLLEAAELAAFYSDAGSQPKAAVHYTQKKFVNKPRGAAPGLVSLAGFKTILVEPKVPHEAVQL